TGTGAGQTSSSAAATTAAASPGKEGKKEGSWVAKPSSDTKITVSFESDGRFAWKVERQGKSQRFAGKSSYENGILTLVQDQTNNTLVGNAQWSDETHFVFKIVGGGTGDPGLSFAKIS